MLEGWLTKRRDHINIIWRNRYFILDGNQLRYYKKRGDPTPNGTLVLTKDCTVGNVFNSEVKHKHHDAVWMFRVTFTIECGEKSYKKDRFVDLGAKTFENAHEWKKELQKAIHSVQITSKNRSNSAKAADIGKTPSVVQKLLGDDDMALFPVLENEDKEKGWWTVRIENGLRIMQECPMGSDSAAFQYAKKARTFNGLLTSSFFSALVAFIAIRAMMSQLILAVLGSLVAIFICSLFFGIFKKEYETPLYRVSQIIQAAPCDVFRLLMNTSRYYVWDGVTASAQVIQEMDDHADIIHLTLKPTFVFPFWQHPRDLLLMRYWRREENGSYFVMFQSTTHPECKPRKGYTRAHLTGGFVIAPQKGHLGYVQSLVSNAVRYDPKGMCSIVDRLGLGIDLVTPLLRRVIGIRDELSSSQFMTPIVTESVSSPSEDAGDSFSIKIDATGVVLGVPKIECNLPSEMWAEPDTSRFMIRGPEYLKDRKKVPAGPPGFHLVGVDLFALEYAPDAYNIGSLPESAMRNVKDEFTIIINMIIPGPENMALAFYFHAARPNILDENSPFSELLNDVLDGDDEFRNSRFKLIPSVVEGSFIIKQSTGSKPALIGKKLKCPYFRGVNYFEMDIDIASNGVANTVVGMARGVTKSLVVDIAYLFESQNEEELPETILGAVRLQKVSLDNPVRIPRKTTSKTTKS